jgi:hypothetical protein
MNCLILDFNISVVIFYQCEQKRSNWRLHRTEITDLLVKLSRFFLLLVACRTKKSLSPVRFKFESLGFQSPLSLAKWVERRSSNSKMQVQLFGSIQWIFCCTLRSLNSFLFLVTMTHFLNYWPQHFRCP